MRNEAMTVEVPTGLYLDVIEKLRRSGDLRSPDHVLALALKNWLRSGSKATGAGYQWKELYLPDGTELRMRYRGSYHYAAVKGDQIMYFSEPVTPRAFVLLVTGTVRNPSRDIWIRRNVNEVWTRADAWRSQPGSVPAMAGANRRRNVRRWSD
ncbi:MAG TPA: hypothetical protein VFT37_13650 [Telluria sp.]|nr:hypothetical protein [Telluria sp.]